MSARLSAKARDEIAEILDRRAQEVASFKTSYCENKDHFGSVELALTREIRRLRDLADCLTFFKAEK